MTDAPEERLQWRKLINRQDLPCGKFWEPGKQARVCSKYFLNGKPTEAFLYPTENLGYTSIFKQKKKKMKSLVRQESLETKKHAFRRHDFCFQEKTEQLFLSFGQDYLASLLFHIVGMLKTYTFIAYYCDNIVHKNKKKEVVLQALFNSNQSLLQKVKHLTKKNILKTCTLKTPIDQRIITTHKDVLFYIRIKSKTLINS